MLSLWKGGETWSRESREAPSSQGSECSLVMGQRRWGEFPIKASPGGGSLPTAPTQHPLPPVTQDGVSFPLPPHPCWVRVGRGSRRRSQGWCPAAGPWGGADGSRLARRQLSHLRASRGPAPLWLSEGLQGVLSGGEGAFLISFSSISAVP